MGQEAFSVRCGPTGKRCNPGGAGAAPPWTPLYVWPDVSRGKRGSLLCFAKPRSYDPSFRCPRSARVERTHRMHGTLPRRRLRHQHQRRLVEFDTWAANPKLLHRSNVETIEHLHIKILISCVAIGSLQVWLLQSEPQNVYLYLASWF